MNEPLYKYNFIEINSEYFFCSIARKPIRSKGRQSSASLYSITTISSEEGNNQKAANLEKSNQKATTNLENTQQATMNIEEKSVLQI